VRHEGEPLKKIKQIFNEYKTNESSKIVITGQVAKKHLSLPYYSEVECLEKALSHLNLKPDILISLGGEMFNIYPMKNGVIKNIISSSKCAAGTGEFIVQQFQRMGMSIEEGIEASRNGKLVEMATRCSVHCKSDATHKLNKGECQRADIAKTQIYDLARKVSEMIELTQWSKDLIVVYGGVTLNKVFIANFASPAIEVVIIFELYPNSTALCRAAVHAVLLFATIRLYTLLNTGSSFFGVSVIFPIIPSSITFITSRGTFFNKSYLSKTFLASEKVVESGLVGPEEINSKGSLIISDIITFLYNKPG